VQLGTNGVGNGVLVHLRNNLFRKGFLDFYGGNTGWTVRDNLFDTMGRLQDHGSAVQNCTNAYYSTTYGLSGGVRNTNLASLTYQAWALGKYYQPGASYLINAGSCNASNVGLYQFTTTTNQVKEGSSRVDIGLHYVALDANGNLYDTDMDGLSDVLEDTNGNGGFDAGETDWRTYDSRNDLVGSPSLKVFTPLKQ
jgi:hypothetical protein